MALVIKEDTLRRHKEAMYFAQDAVVARQAGDELAAIINFGKAFGLELIVLEELISSGQHIETISVISRSAATIAYNGNRFNSAIQVLEENKYEFSEHMQIELDELLLEIESKVQFQSELKIFDYVVVVERNAAIRAILKEVLSTRVKVQIFDRIECAFDFIKSNGSPFSIVVGRELEFSEYETLNDLVKKLHFDLENYTTTVISIGNWGDESDFKLLGMRFEFFAKPFDPQQVLKVISNVKGDHLKEFKDSNRDHSSVKIRERGFGKRIMDMFISGVCLIALAPIFALVALIIKVTSKGSVLAKSLVVGRNYRSFWFYKFRVMYADADQRLIEWNKHHGRQYEEGYENRFFVINNDPRLTPVGKLLRKSALEELPQLLNVFIGHMSLVGNRPLNPYEAVTLTTDEWAERFSVNAGITGLWQVEKERNLNMGKNERLELDRKYSRTSSFWSDIRLLFETAIVLFFRRRR